MDLYDIEGGFTYRNVPLMQQTPTEKKVTPTTTTPNHENIVSDTYRDYERGISFSSTK